MKPRPQHTSALVLLAALALGAYGCSDNSGDKLGQKMSRDTQAAKEKMDQAADSARTSAGDAVIAAKVKAKIVDDPGLKISAINVDTKDGVVVLTGTVNKPEDAMRAEQLAQSVDSVKSVENHLTVRSNG
jgi:hyperosmotically inducible periplasmic protein